MNDRPRKHTVNFAYFSSLCTRSLAPVSLIVILTMGLPAWAAGRGEAQFDVPRVATCRDVTPAEFYATNPADKLIEVCFSISCFLPSGHPDDRFQLVYRVRSEDAGTQVIDYAPRTTLAPMYAGTIQVQAQDHSQAALAVNASARYPLFAEADGSASSFSNHQRQQSYEVLPPLQLLAASGTTDRGQGVFYKLRPSPRSTLEGSQDFRIVLRVPRVWRADYVRVECEAQVQRPDQPFQSAPLQACGQSSFLMALHLAGDAAARAMAFALSDAERNLRQVALAQQSMIHQRAYPTPLHEVVGLLDAVPPKIPRDWLEQTLAAGARTYEAKYTRHLPLDVRQAGRAYQLTALRLRAMNGNRMIASHAQMVPAVRRQ